MGFSSKAHQGTAGAGHRQELRQGTLHHGPGPAGASPEAAWLDLVLGLPGWPPIYRGDFSSSSATATWADSREEVLDFFNESTKRPQLTYVRSYRNPYRKETKP